MNNIIGSNTGRYTTTINFNSSTVVNIDMVELEARVMANYQNNLYKVLGAELFGISQNEVTPYQEQQVKKWLYRKMYGG